MTTARVTRCEESEARARRDSRSNSESRCRRTRRSSRASARTPAAAAAAGSGRGEARAARRVDQHRGADLEFRVEELSELKQRGAARGLDALVEQDLRQLEPACGGDASGIVRDIARAPAHGFGREDGKTEPDSGQEDEADDQKRPVTVLRGDRYRPRVLAAHARGAQRLVPEQPLDRRSGTDEGSRSSRVEALGRGRVRGVEPATPGGRIEGEPALAAEPDLDPRMGVVVGHRPEAAGRCRSRSRPRRAQGCPDTAASAPSLPRSAGSSRGGSRSRTRPAGGRPGQTADAPHSGTGRCPAARTRSRRSRRRGSSRVRRSSSPRRTRRRRRVCAPRRPRHLLVRPPAPNGGTKTPRSTAIAIGYRGLERASCAGVGWRTELQTV